MATSATKLADAGAVAGEAFEEFASYLDEMRPRATGEWASARIATPHPRDAELLNMDARALRERGREQVAGSARSCAMRARDPFHRRLAHGA